MKKNFKYYLSTFIMSAIFMAAMLIVSHTQGQYLFTSQMESTGSTDVFTLYGHEFVTSKYILDVVIVVVFPFAFTGLFALIEFIGQRLKGKKKREAEEYEIHYNEFVQRVSDLLNHTHKFNVEDFRHLRENKKFQEVLKKLYDICINGETEENNYKLILRKFDKGTKEREASEYLVSFTETIRKEKDNKDE